MQMLCRNDTKDLTAWRKVFDSDAEDRSNAGLSLLQLWTEPDHPNRVWFLLDVNDPQKARAWIDRPLGGAQAEDAGVISSEYHLLETS